MRTDNAQNYENLKDRCTLIEQSNTLIEQSNNLSKQIVPTQLAKSIHSPMQKLAPSHEKSQISVMKPLIKLHNLML